MFNRKITINKKVKENITVIKLYHHSWWYGVGTGEWNITMFLITHNFSAELRPLFISVLLLLEK